MTSNTSLFTKSLGQNLGDASQICSITASTGAIGINLSVMQVSGLDRNYRVSVPPNATGSGVWRRLVPFDKTEKFVNQNHWAVDMTCADNVTTLRLVRTRAGTPPASTTLKCNVKAFPSVGATVTIADSTTTATNATNAGIYDGALITQIDGMVGINTDSPSDTLDVLGNVNIFGVYKIGGVNVLTANALGNTVLTSALNTVGTLSSLNVAGGVSLTGLSAATTGNVMYVNPSSGAVSYGALDVSGNLSVFSLTASGNVSATSLNGTLATAAQPNITSVGNLSSLTVTGNARTGNTVTVGTAEVWDRLNETERWRWMASSDGAGNYFQLESFVNSQWQGVVRIDK